jgi:acetylornithine deacetylase/succinyl-diaminopimelate desuccinylase-like protein
VLADERGADAAIVFESGMIDADTPAITLATRGMVFSHLEVRTGVRPVHSGMYGGAALNAFHALHRALAAVLPGPDGRLPEPLRAGLIAPAPEEVEEWKALPDGAGELANVGARPSDARAEAEFWIRTGAEPSLDVNMVAGGEVRTIVPEVARAAVSVRLAAGQSSKEIAANLEQLLRDALPEGAELSFSYDGAEPSRFDPALPALQAARRALGDPALVRSGGTLPILAAFSQRGIPAIVGGYALPEDQIHSPDESYRLVSLEQGAEAARALYLELASLK